MKRIPNPKLALETDVPTQPRDHASASSDLGHSEAHPLQLPIGIFTLPSKQAGCGEDGDA